MNAISKPLEVSTGKEFDTALEQVIEQESKMQKVKKVARRVYIGYQVLAFLFIVSLIIGYVVLSTKEYRDLVLPYKSNIYTKTCMTKTESGTVIEGTRTVFDRFQTLGPLHWFNKTESSGITKVTMRGEPMTVIGMTDGALAFSKQFAASDRGAEQIKQADTLIFVLGNKQDVTIVPFSEFCK